MQDRHDRVETHETVLDDIEERAGFRAFFAKHAWLDISYRVAVGIVGAAVVVQIVGVERDAEQASLAVGTDPRAEVEERPRGHRAVVHDPDLTGLLRDEQAAAAVLGRRDGHRLVEAARTAHERDGRQRRTRSGRGSRDHRGGRRGQPWGRGRGQAQQRDAEQERCEAADHTVQVAHRATLSGPAAGASRERWTILDSNQ